MTFPISFVELVLKLKQNMTFPFPFVKLGFKLKSEFSGIHSHFNALFLVFSHQLVSNSFWPHGLQYTRLPCPSPSPGVCSSSCPLNWWCHPTTSSSIIPFSFFLQSFPSIRVFSSELALRIKAMKLQLHHQSFQWVFRIHLLYDWLVWSPCSPRDSQESSPAPQFGSINSLALCLLYGQKLITYSGSLWLHVLCTSRGSLQETHSSKLMPHPWSVSPSPAFSYFAAIS